MHHVHFTLPVPPKGPHAWSGNEVRPILGNMPKFLFPPEVVYRDEEKIVLGGYMNHRGEYLEPPENIEPGILIYGIHQADDDDPSYLKSPTTDDLYLSGEAGNLRVILDSNSILDIGYAYDNRKGGQGASVNFWRAVLSYNPWTTDELIQHVPQGSNVEPGLPARNDGSGGGNVPMPPEVPGVPEPPIG